MKITISHRPFACFCLNVLHMNVRLKFHGGLINLNGIIPQLFPQVEIVVLLSLGEEAVALDIFQTRLTHSVSLEVKFCLSAKCQISGDFRA